MISGIEKCDILIDLMEQLLTCAEKLEVTPKELSRFLLTAHAIGESMPDGSTDEEIYSRLYNSAMRPFPWIMSQGDEHVNLYRKFKPHHAFVDGAAHDDRD